MRKSLTLALPLIVAGIALAPLLPTRADISVTNDTTWDMQQKIKALEKQVQSLKDQIAKLEADKAQLQADKQALQGKLDQIQQKLEVAQTQSAAPVALTIQPPDLLKGYPQDKLPIYGDPSNVLRIRSLNDYLAKNWGNRLLTISGLYANTVSANDTGITILLSNANPTDPIHWTAYINMPQSASDEILQLKKGDPLTVTATLTRALYSQPNPKFSQLMLMFKQGAITPPAK